MMATIKRWLGISQREERARELESKVEELNQENRTLTARAAIANRKTKRTEDAAMRAIRDLVDRMEAESENDRRDRDAR